MAKEYQAIKTDTTRLSSLHAIAHMHSFIHNDVYTLSFYPDKTGALHPYQSRDLHPLWQSQLPQFDLTIQYDESLQPCAGLLQQLKMAHYFPAEYLLPGSRRLPLSIVLTGPSSFAELNQIDSKNPALRFVFRYACNEADPLAFFKQMVATVYHETEHYFQLLDGQHYDRYYPEDDNTTRQRALLKEAVAAIRGHCAIVLAPSFTSFQINKPNDRSKFVLADITTSDLWHSEIGAQLGVMWSIQFVDQEGFIYKKNTTQFAQYQAACRADSAELIGQAAAVMVERLVTDVPAKAVANAR
jgi:hypothetical protein